MSSTSTILSTSSSTSSSTQPIKVILSKQLDMSSLKKAADTKQVADAVAELVKNMISRNHGLYFVELSELDTIVKQHSVISPCRFKTGSEVEKAFTLLQATHQELPTDVDIQPSAHWEYVKA